MVLPMAIPIAAPMAVAALAGLKILNSNREKKREAFYTMNWAPAPEGDVVEEGCVLIGEEVAVDGEQWFVCTEPQSDGACEPIAEYGSPGMVPGSTQHDEYLCKHKKM
eukprot:jgi/Chrpa1/12869/Chrysochromulina_OHIO_Genome00001049-RA